MKNKIIHGECINEMKKLLENSVNAIITDPPYGIGFMGKEWDNFKPSAIKEAVEKDGRIKTRIASTRDSTAAGTYDLSKRGMLGFQKWVENVSKECLRVLKPGGFMLVFGGTRTYHRLVCGIEDAGFEIRDTIMWLYGSGFPKSLNIGKQVDKIKGNERKIIGIKQHAKKDFKSNLYAQDPANKNNEKVFGYGEEEITRGNSEWEGWGTALKPACEPIVVARKPLSEKNVALNVLKWGTGGINIDACRIPLDGEKQPSGSAKRVFKSNKYTDKKIYGDNKITPEQGRFPANIILDEEVGKMLDWQSGILKSGDNCIRQKEGFFIEHGGLGKKGDIQKTYGDKGGASRFFYCAKSSKSERNLGCDVLETKEIAYKDYRDNVNNTKSYVSEYPDGKPRPMNKPKNNHPTVKPIKLMEYLVKLVSKESVTILDPFLGSGTTAIACLKLNRKFIGIEKEKEYIKIAKARIKPFLKQTKL